MKKNRLILSGLAVALLGASAAFAAPHMGGFGPRPHGGPGMAAHSHEQREMKRIPDGAPEETAPLLAYQADSTATSASGLKEDFNALLAKLRTAGLMPAEAPAEPPVETPGEGEGGGT